MTIFPLRSPSPNMSTLLLISLHPPAEERSTLQVPFPAPTPTPSFWLCSRLFAMSPVATFFVSPFFSSPLENGYSLFQVLFAAYRFRSIMRPYAPAVVCRAILLPELEWPAFSFHPIAVRRSLSFVFPPHLRDSICPPSSCSLFLPHPSHCQRLPRAVFWRLLFLALNVGFCDSRRPLSPLF